MLDVLPAKKSVSSMRVGLVSSYWGREESGLGEILMKFLTNFFERLKGRRTAPIRAPHHSVYVVLLEGVPSGTGKDVYVGMTGLTPEERFANHKRGYKKNSKVMRYGVKLLPELYHDLNPMTYEQACRMEKVLANRLTKQGFNVFCGQ